ncbi:hypothetical protein [Aureibacter tunicatorum]|uniref:Uncharacterized protein n=1 Tax=Aureibacter tunicatorum TaxID=866807 RepID=A0AAE4BT55_9BACT|nr:hypothetical protein [Aureibacter tunicatorum]MDR6239503.1 hypothetical protein [Aureibacter tunicatorum]BDD04577.1 hypothetical protein AUTU_20600 [Aureibacter tunicatorum]
MKKLKKLALKKNVLSELTNEEQGGLRGGGTSRRNCTGFLCCDPSGGEGSYRACHSEKGALCR